MYLREDKIKHGDKIYKYYRIVAAYRDKNGKPSQKVLLNLGKLSEDDAEKIRTVMSITNADNVLLAKSSDIVVLRHWLFLPVVVLHSIWQMFDFDNMFASPLLVESMVINRCIEPRSKIQITDWVSQTVLPALCKCVVLPEEYAVYRELDYISKNEELMQSHLFKQLEKVDISLDEGFFYDITSTYIEGGQCVIAKLGYSRDHRPDLQQIVIALMVTTQGSPFYWKVLDGNTQDVTTLPSVVTDLKKRFNLGSCHLVFDRGMVSSDHLTYLEGHSITYLTAMDKDEIACHSLFNKFMPRPVANEDFKLVLPAFGFSPTDDSQKFYAQEGVVDNRKYIFTFDPVRFSADSKNRNKRMAQITAWVSEKNKSLMAAKKSRKLEPLERDVEGMIKKRKFKNILRIDIVPFIIPITNKKGAVRTVQSYQLEISIDMAKYDSARRLDGITCFITNVLDMSHASAIQKYRDKNKIEEAFREMKSSLALRPIHLTRTERVKAHVSICVLAYLMMNTMEIMLEKEKVHITSTEVLNRMKSCQLNEVGFKDSVEHSIVMTQITQQQKTLVELLKCDDYLKPNSLKMLTNFMKK